MEYLIKAKFKKTSLFGGNSKSFEDLKELKNHEQKNALHVACEVGHSNAVKKLLNNKMDPEMETKHKMNALHLAVQEKNLECVDAIIKHYEEKKLSLLDIMTAVNLDNNKAIMLALKNTKTVVNTGDYNIENDSDNVTIKIVKNLLKAIVKTSDLTNLGGKGGTRSFLLEYCSEFGSVEALKFVCKFFKMELEDFNIIEDEENHFRIAFSKNEIEASFMKALMANNDENIKYFLENEILRKNLDESFLNSSFNQSIQESRHAIFDILKNEVAQDIRSRKENLYMSAVASKDYETIKKVAAYMDDDEERKKVIQKMLKGFDKSKSSGNTPLHEASLLSFHKKDLENEVPEGEEIIQQKEEEFEFLLDHYKKNNILLSSLANALGCSVLHLAAENGSIIKVKGLLEPKSLENSNEYLEKSKIDAALAESKRLLFSTDKEKNQAIHIAAIHNKHEVFKYLLMESKNKTPQNKNGETPLHMIAKSGADKVSFLFIFFSISIHEF